MIVGIGPDDFTGFGGGGYIYLEEGNDRIFGFGAQTVNGGTGTDTAQFNFDRDDLESIISFGVDDQTNISIGANGVFMNFINVEQFIFNDGEFTVEQLTS